MFDERPRVHGEKTGRVWIRDFNLGMVTTLGAVIENDGTARRYVLTLPTLPEGENKVVVTIINSELVTVPERIPAILLRPDSVTPALERKHPFAEEYRVPSPAAVPATAIDPRDGTLLHGHSAYETKEQAEPFDFEYTVECWHRHRNWAEMILFHAMRTFPPQGAMSLVDSLGDTRTYNAFQEGGISELTDSGGLTDRLVGLSISVRVTGELDLRSEETYPSARSFAVDYGLKPRE